MNGILGKKIKMTQVFSKDGERYPVTEIEAGPCFLVFERTKNKDDYRAIGLGFEKKNDKNEYKFIREIKIEENEELPSEKVIRVDQVLKPGDLVEVTGISKGMGFTGVVKRHHFRGGPRTHGQSDRERAPGSIGSTTTPGRVLKGKRMAGKEGGKKVTVKNLLVVSVDGSTNKVLVKGAIPGKPKSLLIIRKIGEKNFKKEIIVN